MAMPNRMPMISTTTMSSTSVKPLSFRRRSSANREADVVDGVAPDRSVINDSLIVTRPSYRSPTDCLEKTGLIRRSLDE